MNNQPMFFVFRDRTNRPVRYEAGYFESPLEGHYIQQCDTESDLLIAIKDFLVYNGYTRPLDPSGDITALEAQIVELEQILDVLMEGLV